MTRGGADRRSAGTRLRIAVSAAALAIVAGASGCAPTGGSTTPPPHPTPPPTTADATEAVSIWAAAPVPGVPVTDELDCPAAADAFPSGTVQEVVHPSAPADRVRVRLSNRYGTGPLSVTAVTIAVRQPGPSAATGDVRRLTFGGARSVSIGAGQEADSDFTTLGVTPDTDLAVGFRVLAAHGPATVHPLGLEVSTLLPGDPDATARLAGPQPSECWLFLTRVDAVRTPALTGTVVAFGDSITDGAKSTVGADARWPDDLARRLRASGSGLSVVDEGIAGNRLLDPGPPGGRAGDAALDRFAADALDVPGVRTIVLLEGVNDIGHASAGQAPAVTSATLTAAYRTLVAAAHARGVRVVGCTITPFSGARYWTPEGERVRDAVNRWILRSGVFDAAADTAAAIADPLHPDAMRGPDDSGDHLHPDDAGYAAMADAIAGALERPAPPR